MRLVLLGKGGSGKTSVASAYIRFLGARRPVLAIDADVNVHLGDSLGIASTSPLLGDHFTEIAEALRGDRTDLGARPLIGATPPARGSRLVKPSFDDALIERFGCRRDNITLLSVGTYTESDIGSSCYHTKLSSLALLMHHMVDGPEDRVVIDATAGIDNLATSLSFAYDLNLFVVEPTLKSTKVLRDFVERSAPLNISIAAIANKVRTRGDLDFIRSQIPEDLLIGVLPDSEDLRQCEKGNHEGFSRFIAQNASVLEKIDTTLKNCPRNWQRYLSSLRQNYQKVCNDWYNTYFKTDMVSNVDSEFCYPAQVS